MRLKYIVDSRLMFLNLILNEPHNLACIKLAQTWLQNFNFRKQMILAVLEEPDNWLDRNLHILFPVD